MIVCDKCKKELNKFEICELTMESPVNPLYNAGELHYHLCYDCWELLFNYIRNFKVKKTEDKNEL